MMSMWLDYLKTPMAAPETGALKAMRMAILAICFALPVLVVSIAPLKLLIGHATGGVIAALVIALFVVVPAYVIIKNRADGAHLDAMIAERAE